MHRRRLSGHSFVSLSIVIFFAFIFSVQNACADGKHFPQKAYKKAPVIPSQRAILAYKDGVEKLVIESSLEGQGLEFGWVIPLPSKPTEFEKTSAGLINTFSLALQPEIVHDLTRDLNALLYGAAFVTLTCLIVVFTKSLDRIGLLVLLVIVFGFIMMPTLGIRFRATATTDIPGVRVHDVRQVGSYELAVLETESSQALDAWLEDNGFAGLSEEDEKIVSDYVQDQWYFVAAKLRRQGDGYSRPHPLSMSFSSDKPIYPMRLTATTGSDVYLELYVIADKQATCDALTLEVSDVYRSRKESGRYSSAETLRSSFAGKTFSESIGHPDAAKVMWDGCFLSKLCGSLKPKDMREDIVLRLTAAGPHQERYYSRRGARETAIVLFLRMWCVLPVGLTLVRFVKKKELSSKRLFIKKALAPTLVLSLLAGVVAYAVLPKIDVKTFSGRQGDSRVANALRRHTRISELSILAQDHDNFAGIGTEEIAGLLGDYFKSKDTVNVYTGEPIKREDSPGDYTVIEDERGVVWRTYSRRGYPEDHVLRPLVED